MASDLINAVREAETQAKQRREEAKKQAASYISSEKQRAEADAAALVKKANDEAEAMIEEAKRRAAEVEVNSARSRSEKLSGERERVAKRMDEAALLILKERIGT